MMTVVGCLTFCLMLSGWAETETPRDNAAHIDWQTDYTAAVAKARQDRKLLLIYFESVGKDKAKDAFQANCLIESIVAPHADRFVWARLPLETKIRIDGNMVTLVRHPAFAYMLGRPGIAMIDYQNRSADYHGYLVSAFPFAPGKYYKPDAFSVMLDLPSGTITQRTMVFAVRIHPDAPASSTGRLSNILAGEAESHSHHQASIALQGHHEWENRFHRINGRLKSNLTAQEVVAESWGGEDLVEAAIECVHSWRQSPGHWSAVSSRQTLFGFDIKLGRNGVWYATGLFAR